MRCRVIERRHSAPARAVHTANMSPFVLGLEIDCAHGHLRWGFMWRITSGLRWGILLEPYPLVPVRLLVRGLQGGPLVSQTRLATSW